ncbi:MAG: GYD domain-containing protein [Candidatus Hodarchaeota archaeon]
MSTYIILGNFTQLGLKTIKKLPEALEQSQNLAKSLGGKYIQLYITMGRYDFVGIVEAPNNEAAIKALLTIGMAGTISTETLTAIPVEKAIGIIKELP